MKLLIFIIFLLALSFACVAQKQPLVGDNSRYMCLNDSLLETAYIDLRANQVDSLITVLDDYDNGRVAKSKSAILWQFNGKSYGRIMIGYDSTFVDSTFELDLVELWTLVNDPRLRDTVTQIKPFSYRSHGMFHYVSVTVGQSEFFFSVWDDQRSMTESWVKSEIDPRISFVNLIAKLLNQHFN